MPVSNQSIADELELDDDEVNGADGSLKLGLVYLVAFGP